MSEIHEQPASDDGYEIPGQAEYDSWHRIEMASGRAAREDAELDVALDDLEQRSNYFDKRGVLEVAAELYGEEATIGAEELEEAHREWMKRNVDRAMIKREVMNGEPTVKSKGPSSFSDVSGLIKVEEELTRRQNKYRVTKKPGPKNWKDAEASARARLARALGDE